MDLRLGDCLDVMSEIPDCSIDLIFADLPYGTTRCRWDTEIDLDRLWEHYLRISNGAIVLFAQPPFDKKLGMSKIELLKYEWIWRKTHPTGHLNAKKSPLKAHENLLVFYRELPTYNPIKTTGHPRKVATKRSDKTPVYGDQKFKELHYDSTERYPTTVLTFPSDKQRSKLHQAQKPLDLCRYIVKTYTDPGDLVLDNVMGSGTTGVAAMLEGRRFIGIEKDPEIFQVASNRIANEFGTRVLQGEAT